MGNMAGPPLMLAPAAVRCCQNDTYRLASPRCAAKIPTYGKRPCTVKILSCSAPAGRVQCFHPRTWQSRTLRPRHTAGPRHCRSCFRMRFGIRSPPGRYIMQFTAATSVSTPLHAGMQDAFMDCLTLLIEDRLTASALYRVILHKLYTLWPPAYHRYYLRGPDSGEVFLPYQEWQALVDELREMLQLNQILGLAPDSR